MKKFGKSRILAAVLSFLMVLGTISIPAMAETNSAQTLGTVVLSETFDATAEKREATEINDGEWNGWTLYNGSGSNYEKDSYFYTVWGTQEEVWAGNSSARQPMETFLKLQRTGATNPAGYYMQKGISVPDSANSIEIAFRIMRDANANQFQIRLINGTNYIDATTIYLNRSANGGRQFLLNSGVAGEIRVDGMGPANSFQWYDVRMMFDYSDKKLYVYLDNQFVGSSDLVTNKFSKPADIKKFEIGSARTGNGACSFYLDDLEIKSYTDAEKGALIAEKLKGYIPGIVTGANREPTTFTLATTLYGEAVTYSENSDLLSLQNGVCTVTHPESGNISYTTLTASVNGVAYDYNIGIAPKNVYVAENFEGNYAVAGSGKIAGVNGWTNSWADKDDATLYTTSEGIISDIASNHAARLYRTKDGLDHPNFYLKKAFGADISSSTGKGISISFRMKSSTDSTKQINLLLFNGTSDKAGFEIYMNRGQLKLSDGYASGSNTPLIFAGPDMQLKEAYPSLGAIAGKWYDVEIYSDLKANGNNYLYIDGEYAGKLAPLAKDVTVNAIAIQPARKAMGANAEFLFDDVVVKTVTENEMALKAAADEITLFNKTVYENVSLPTSAGNDISVAWKSSDEAVIKNDGTIATKNADCAKMTATFTKGSDSITRVYPVSVGAAEAAKLVSISKIDKKAVVNVNSARLTDKAKLIVAAFKEEKLLKMGTYDISNAVGTVTADLSTWWTTEIPDDTQIKAFIWDMGTLQPLTLHTIQSANAATIYFCGDSLAHGYTYKDTEKDSNIPEEKRLAGWVEPFAQYFDLSTAVVENYAESGYNVKEFYELENGWKKVMSNVKKGDYIFVSFAHNDQGDLGSDYTENTYKEYLGKMADEAKAKRANIVFVTSVDRAKGYVNGKFETTLGNFSKLMKDVATEKSVPVIDLNSATIEWFKAEGEEKVMKNFVYSYDGYDTTHLTEIGARKIASMVVDLIKENTALAGLAGYLK